MEYTCLSPVEIPDLKPSYAFGIPIVSIPPCLRIASSNNPPCPRNSAFPTFNRQAKELEYIVVKIEQKECKFTFLGTFPPLPPFSGLKIHNNWKNKVFTVTCSIVLTTVSSLWVELMLRGTRWWENPTKWYCGSVRAVSIAIAAEATLGVMVVPWQLPHDIEPLTSMAKRYLLLVGSTFCKGMEILTSKIAVT